MQNNNNQYASNKNNKKGNNNNQQQYKQYKGPDQNQVHENQLQKQRSQNNQRSESDTNQPPNGGGSQNSGGQPPFNGGSASGSNSGYNNRNNGNNQYYGNNQYGNGGNSYNNQNYGGNRNYRDRKGGGGYHHGGGGYQYHHNNGGGGYHNNYFSKNYYDQYPEDGQRQIIQEGTEDPVSKADQDQKWKHDKYDQVMQETNSVVQEPTNSRPSQSQYSHEGDTSFSSGSQTQGDNYQWKGQQRYNKGPKQGYNRGYDQRFNERGGGGGGRGKKNPYNYNQQMHDNFQYQPAINNNQGYQDYGQHRKGSVYDDHGPYRERTESFGQSENEYEQIKVPTEQLEQQQIPKIDPLPQTQVQQSAPGLPQPPQASVYIQGVQSNIQHMMPKQSTQTIIQLIIRLSAQEEIQIQITEDTNPNVSPLNFYDIQYQIEHQLMNHKSRLAKELESHSKDDQKPQKNTNEDLVEAFQFYVKRQLQLQNINKYQKIAENTYQIQQIQIHSLGNLVNQINLQQQLQNQSNLFNRAQKQQPQKAEAVENKMVNIADQIGYNNQWSPDQMNVFNALSGKSDPFYPSTPIQEQEKKDPSPLKNSPQTQNIIQYNAQTVNFVQYMPGSGSHFEAPPTDKQSKNFNQAQYLRQMQLNQEQH